jgi:hypothetical protein
VKIGAIHPQILRWHCLLLANKRISILCPFISLDAYQVSFSLAAVESATWLGEARALLPSDEEIINDRKGLHLHVRGNQNVSYLTILSCKWHLVFQVATDRKVGDREFAYLFRLLRVS